MTRVLGFLCVLVGASFAAAIGASSAGSAAQPAAKASAAPAHPASSSSKPATKPQTKPAAIRLAPADEYFGPMKMSVLGIRNEIHDLTIRYEVSADADHKLSKSIMSIALLTEASLADWEKKYPADNQLARDVYLLQHLYAKIDADDARAKAKYCSNWLFSHYGKTWYAKDLHQTLANGNQPAAQNGQPAAASDPSHPSAPAGVGAGVSPAAGSGTTPSTGVGAGAGANAAPSSGSSQSTASSKQATVVPVPAPPK